MGNEITTTRGMTGELLPPTDALNNMWKVCERLVKSGMLPTNIRQPEQAFAIALKGRELGIPPMMAFNSINVIEGRTELSATLMSAMLRRGGVTIEEVEVNDRACEIIFHRGDETARVRWTMEDAARAGLAGKRNWKTYPRQMLYARALSEGARRIGPDLVHGAYIIGEISGNEPVDGTPAPSPPEPTQEPEDAVVTVTSVERDGTVILDRTEDAAQKPEKGDGGEPEPEPAPVPASTPGGRATIPQCQAIHAAARMAGVPEDDLRGMLSSRFGVMTTKELSRDDASALIDELRAMGKARN